MAQVARDLTGHGRVSAMLAMAGFLVMPALAQAPDPSRSVAPGDPESSRRLDERQLELRGLEGSLRQSDEQRRKLQADIEAMRNDRARLNSALIDTTTKARAAETRLGEIEKRLESSLASEGAIRKSLEARRGVIAEVLAALQRMGRRPPPAVLVRPEDILQAVRTSILLGAVVPELRDETQTLASDLNDLVQVRRSIAREREARTAELASLGAERERISALVDARQQSLSQAQQVLDSEAAKARELAQKATDLKDLISRMESEVASAGRGAEAARRADAITPQERLRLAGMPQRDPARLTPAVPFGDAKGLLPIPVAGMVIKSYGAADGFGGTEKGLSISTRTGAVVSSPADGWVSFVGSYRNYGQLLIVNVGGGYYLVLAGMQKTSVELGQFVLAGEPVATMGDGSAKTAAAIALGAAQPILYVELRKDGAAIDPGPWWAKPELEKVRG
jgi:septal ring factor EnvC (AmiA/AmiB activator)